MELHTLFNEGHVTDAHKLATRLFEATRMLFTEGYFKLTLRYAVNRLMKEKCGGKTLGNETKFVFLSEQDDKSAEKLTERLFTEYSDLLWNFNRIMDSFSLLSEIKKYQRNNWIHFKIILTLNWSHKRMEVNSNLVDNRNENDYKTASKDDNQFC